MRNVAFKINRPSKVVQEHAESQICYGASTIFAARATDLTIILPVALALQECVSDQGGTLEELKRYRSVLVTKVEL